MGSFSSKENKIPPPTPTLRPNAIERTKFQIDRKIELPEEYKSSGKDICKHIRNLYTYQDDDDIQGGVNLHCRLDNIEDSIFENLSTDAEYFPVRLYISNKIPKNFFESIKFFVVGVAAKNFTELGTNHLAVQVCDKIVHWFNGSIVCITPFSGDHCIALFYPQKDGMEYPSIENNKENRTKICKLIQNWNCKVEYSQTKNNCQHFASEMFKVLDLDNKFSNMTGPIGYFLNYIAKPTVNLEFPCIISNEGSIIKQFETHLALDEWTVENEVEKKGHDYHYLVKGFHRGFQAKKQIGQTACPMHDPTLLQVNKEKDEKGHVQGGSGGSGDTSFQISSSGLINIFKN